MMLVALLTMSQSACSLGNKANESKYMKVLVAFITATTFDTIVFVSCPYS